MNRNRPDYRVGVGASSVLMILVVLAMAALSLLAFGSARDTEALTLRNVEMSAAYYEAAAGVQRKLALIDEAVLEYRQSHPGEELDPDWFSALGLQGVEWRAEDGGLSFSITAAAGGSRAISAQGQALTGDGPRYKLTGHAAYDAGAREEPQTLTLMGE